MKKLVLLLVCVAVSMSFFAQGKKVGLLSVYGSVEEIKDDDEKAAAEWFVNSYEGDFIPVAQIISKKVNLANYDVLWINLEEDAALPEALFNKTLLEGVKTYYKNGGNLFVSRYGCLYLKDLGRMTVTPKRVDNKKGDRPAGMHAINAYIGKNSEYDRNSHAIYANIIPSNQYIYPTYPMTKGARRDNNVAWLLEKEVFTASGKNAVRKFEKQENAKVLGTWGQERSYNAANIIEYLPNSDFKGNCIAVGIGCYEWNLVGGNPYHYNIIRLTTNILDYLSGKEIIRY